VFCENLNLNLTRHSQARRSPGPRTSTSRSRRRLSSAFSFLGFRPIRVPFHSRPLFTRLCPPSVAYPRVSRPPTPHRPFPYPYPFCLRPFTHSRPPSFLCVRPPPFTLPHFPTSSPRPNSPPPAYSLPLPLFSAF
jgi:hypothetical protein